MFLGSGIGNGIIFDGNGKTIIINNANNYNGTFLLVGGTIKNLAVVVSDTSTLSNNSGYIFAQNSYGTIDTVSLKILSPSSLNGSINVGGFAGQLNTDGSIQNISFNNCTYYGCLGQNLSAGFIASLNNINATFTSCVSTITNWGVVGGNSNAVKAGFIGIMGGSSSYSINRCIALTNDSNTNVNCVGFIGESIGSTNSITASYFVYNSQDASFQGSAFIIDNYTDTTFESLYFYDSSNVTKDGVFVNTNHDNSTIKILNVNCYTSTSELSSKYTSEGGNLIDNYDFTIPITQTDMGQPSENFPWNYDVSPPILNFEGQFITTPWSSNIYNSSTDNPTLDMSLVCFLKGTQIRVLFNNNVVDKKIEELSKGDEVITLNGIKKIVKITNMRIVATKQNCPYLVPKDYYGQDLPYEDLYLSPWHALYIDGKFHHLNCNKNHTYDEKFIGQYIEYYHLCFDSYPEVVYSNGLTSESCGILQRPHVKNLCNKEECKIWTENKHFD
jgi:hypothetical protein